MEEWLTRHFEASPEGRCAGCGREETTEAGLVPFGIGAGRAWLHPDCWEEWFAQRRAEAVAGLTAMRLALI